MDTSAPITKHATATRDPDAQEINRLHNDVERRADIGEILRRVFGRLYFNRSYLRQWIGKHCDFSVASALRYMLLSRFRHELKAAGIITLADSYRRLQLDSQLSINLADPRWEQVAVPVEGDEIVPEVAV